MEKDRLFNEPISSGVLLVVSATISSPSKESIKPAIPPPPSYIPRRGGEGDSTRHCPKPEQQGRNGSFLLERGEKEEWGYFLADFGIPLS